MRHIADEMKRLHPKIRGAKRFAELIVEAAKNNPEVKKLIRLQYKSGRTKTLSVGSIRKIIAKPQK